MAALLRVVRAHIVEQRHGPVLVFDKKQTLKISAGWMREIRLMNCSVQLTRVHFDGIPSGFSHVPD
jgi:hypothetical protein